MLFGNIYFAGAVAGVVWMYFQSISFLLSKNDIIGVLYRHPSMDTEAFNDEHFRPLLQKLTCENNKNICIAGDFNINLLNVSSHDPSADFIDILTAHNYMPTITLPTKINTSGVHTLIDNIYSNIFNPDIISGNITFNVSDGHLPSFAIFPKSNKNHLPKKHNFFKHNTQRLNPNNPDFPVTRFEISQEINALDWGSIIKPEKFDPNYSLEKFEQSISPIIQKYLPLEKVKNKEHKRKYKPWITNGIQTSIKHRDKLLYKYKKEKNQAIKFFTKTTFLKIAKI